MQRLLLAHGMNKDIYELAKADEWTSLFPQDIVRTHKLFIAHVNRPFDNIPADVIGLIGNDVLAEFGMDGDLSAGKKDFRITEHVVFTIITNMPRAVVFMPDRSRADLILPDHVREAELCDFLLAAQNPGVREFVFKTQFDLRNKQRFAETIATFLTTGQRPLIITP